MPRLPRPGESVLAAAPEQFLGGKGANQAVAAARSGARVSVIGAVGEDEFGSWFIKLFEQESIDTSRMTRVAMPTGTAAVIVGPDGGNQIAVHAGANMALDARSIEEAPITDEDFILAPLEVPDDCLIAAARKGRLILNPAPYRKMPESLLADCYGLVVNETEALELTGIDPCDGSHALQAATKIESSGFCIITLGARGALICGSGVELMIPAPRVEAVDSTAAGDVFCGSLVAELSQGKSLEEAARFAVSAASLSVTRLGAIAAIPYRRDVVEI